MNFKSTHITAVRQFIKYGAVGVLNTFITLAAIFILTKALHASYITANAVGYALGFLNSFLLNRRWTFQSKGSIKRESLMFIVVFGASYLLQLVLLIILKQTLHLNEDLSQIAAMIFYTVVSFAGNKIITFRNPANK